MSTQLSEPSVETEGDLLVRPIGHVTFEVAAADAPADHATVHISNDGGLCCDCPRGVLLIYCAHVLAVHGHLGHLSREALRARAQQRQGLVWEPDGEYPSRAMDAMSSAIDEAQPLAPGPSTAARHVPVYQVDPGDDSWFAIPLEGQDVAGALVYVVVGLHGDAHCGCLTGQQRLLCIHALAVRSYLLQQRAIARSEAAAL